MIFLTKPGVFLQNLSLTGAGAIFHENKVIITTETVYTTYSDLKPNQKSPFEITLVADDGKKVKSYAVNVQSSEYSMTTENPNSPQ